MKNIILKSCLIALCLICGLGSAWGEEATITFASQTSGTSDSSTAYTTSTFVSSGITSSDATFGTITCSETSKCYSGKKGYGLKAGASSSAGSFTLSFDKALTNVTKIVINRASYSDSKTATITVKNGNTTLANAVSTPSGTADFADMEITGLNIASLSEITVNTSKYCYIKSITITYSTGSTKTLSSIAVKNPPTKTSYTEGENFDPAGLVITATYSDSDPEDIAYSGNESDFSFSPALTTALTTSNTSVTITYGGKSTAQSITVNEKPKHTAYFSINGTINDAYDCTVTEGSAITFPTGLADINGKKFVGWMEGTISGTADTAPDFVTSATMGTADITYNAVYATQGEGGGSGSADLTSSEMQTHFNATAMAYADDEKSWKDGDVTWSAKAYSTKDANFLQLRKNAILSYVKIQAPGAITSVSFNAKNASDNAFSGTIYLVTEPTSASSTNAVGNVESPLTDGNGTITPTGSNNTLYIQTSAGLRLRDIEITYTGGTTYSGYCTTVPTSGPTDASWAVTPDAVSVEVDKTATATISTDYDGTLSVSSNATGTATATISDKTITVTGVAAGTTTLTVTGAATSNFNAISKTIDVTVTASSATTPAFAYFEETATINVGEILEAKDYCGTIAPDAGFDDYSISTAVCSAIGAADGQKISDDYACIYSKVSFKKAGTYVVHVTAPAVAGKYTASEGYITVTVNSSEENVVFDFNSTAGLSALGINVPTSGEAGANNLAEYYYNGAILMQNTNGSTPNREYYEGEDGIDLRVYNNSSLTFSGATITKIVITGKGMGSMSANDGNVNIAENGTATWTGSSSSVVLSPNASANIRTITVYYNPATVPSTYDVIYDGNSCGGNTVTGTPSDDNAYEANASVNVAAAASLAREGYTFNGWNTKSNGSDATLTAEGTFNIAANTVIYAQWLINSYVVTMTAPENGSFTVSDGTNDISSGASVEYKKKLTLTATPETGYKFKRFVITPEGGEAIYKTTTPADYTMGAANVTIAAEFQALNTYTINWSVNGVLLKTEELTEGSDVTAPTEQEIKDALPDGVEKVFTGWVITPTVDADTTPSYVTPSNATANATYYAVFAKQEGEGEGEGGDYVLVESALEDWTGDYLIAYSNDVFADGRSGGTAGLGKAQSHVDPNEALSTDEKTVAAAWGDTYHVTLEEISENSNTYVLKTQDGNYNYQSSNTNGLASTENKNKAATYPISVNFNNSKNISLALGGNAAGAVLHYNDNAGSSGEMFRFYKNGSQQNIYLYKKSATTGGTTYSDFTTLPYLQLNEECTSIVELEDATCDFVEVTRALKDNGSWNSLCLPFSMDADQISETFGETDIRQLKSASVTKDDEDNETLHLNYEQVNTIEAGNLYLIQVSKKIEKFVVEKAEINTKEDMPEKDYSVTGYTIKTFSNYNYMDGMTNGYVPVGCFVVSNNNFTQINYDKQRMKAFRGYIVATEDATGTPVKALGIGFIDPLTGINNVEFNTDARIYNLQGLQQSKLQKGINIINGKKVIR